MYIHPRRLRVGAERVLYWVGEGAAITLFFGMGVFYTYFVIAESLHDPTFGWFPRVLFGVIGLAPYGAAYFQARRAWTSRP